MSWKPELDELNRRKELARQMGGAENVAFHRSRGKMTVRDRIDALADPGSFQEFGVLAGTPEWDGLELKNLTPTNAVTGAVRIAGRKAVVIGGDFTLRGGASDASIPGKGLFAAKTALTNRIPYIRLLDASGGSVRTFEKMGRTYIPANSRSDESELLHAVPVCSAVLGSVAGLPAVQAALCHFNVMVAGTSRVFVAGPPVVKAALGVEIHKDDLGNEAVQAHISGVIANVAESESDALDQIKRFLSYMPPNVWEAPPRAETGDAPERREESLLSIVPRHKRMGYDPRAILAATLDLGSFFEIQPHFGRSRVTGLARVDGWPVGVMINNPNHLGGALDKDAGEKTARLLQLCDTFHLPLVYFADEPGFMVGLQEEKKGIIRAGARICALLALSQTPYICFVVRQLYGVAGGLHFRGGTNMYRRYAWPSGHWGSMHLEGGVQAAYKREIESAENPEAKRREIESRLNEIMSPFRTAHAFEIEDIIDPRETRPLLCEFANDAQPLLRAQLGQTSRIPYLP